jgi:DNA mismatch repair ATPase MutS
MKAFLLYPDQDVDLQQPLPPNAQMLTQDLELDTLFNAMALGDPFLFEAAKKVVLSSLTDLETIRYRQHILQDGLNNAAIVREMYAVAVEAIAREKKVWGFFRDYPSGILHRSIEVLELFVDSLKKLRQIADVHADRFVSEGFTTFFAMLRRELDDAYFATVQQHLKTLKFRKGVLMSARLGKGNKGTSYVLRTPPDQPQRLIERLFADRPTTYSFTIAERDESGARALSELQDRGINLVANALAQSTDHILSFFAMLRTELAFYVGCLNLHALLAKLEAPTAFPQPVACDERKLSVQGLYDACLALTMKRRVVGNAVQAAGKDLLIITGANQGGKSTFLRSIGLAQLMMQCGLFVPAESFCANVCARLFTHFKRKEDATMKSGKLDEELSRMSEIVGQLTPHSMVLFNESFAATNEREGSEIARQIVSALVEKCIKVCFVTHLSEFARGVYEQKLENALFLRAERQADGRRTFKLLEGEPLQTSYGADVYQRVFKTPTEDP